MVKYLRQERARGAFSSSPIYPSESLKFCQTHLVLNSWKLGKMLLCRALLPPMLNNQQGCNGTATCLGQALTTHQRAEYERQLPEMEKSMSAPSLCQKDY